MDNLHTRTDLQSISALCGYLEDRCERDRSKTAGQLHDEIGGLLVAARLNVAWIQEHLPSDDPQVQLHFRRLHEGLRSGVEVKRRIVEDLHPTLLDNIGLYAALRWQMARSCEAAKLVHSETCPEDELTLHPDAAITVYRVVAEAINNLVTHARARHAHLAVEQQAGELRVTVRDDGIGITAAQRDGATSYGIAAMRHRLSRLGGTLQWPATQERGTEVRIVVPLAALQPQAPSDESLAMSSSRPGNR